MSAVCCPHRAPMHTLSVNDILIGRDRSPNIEPIPGLINTSMMTLLGIGERNNKPHTCIVFFEKFEGNSDNPCDARIMRFECNACEFAGFDLSATIWPAKVAVGAAAKNDGPNEFVILPDADLDGLSRRHRS